VYKFKNENRHFWGIFPERYEKLIKKL